MIIYRNNNKIRLMNNITISNNKFKIYYIYLS